MEALDKIAEAIRGTEFEGKAWLVGGAVRDELLGLPTGNDLDIVVEGDALKLVHDLYDKGVSEIFPAIYANFGTAHLVVGDSKVEFVAARKDSYRSESRKPVVEPATLLEDALRRDLTINTLLKNLSTGQISDPTGLGLHDLEARILRTPEDPRRMLEEDPLRMLRLVRFKHKFGLTPVGGLWDTLKQSAPRLKIISEERIQEEFVKILLLPNAGAALTDLLELDILDQFAPELVAMVGVEQGRWHHLDVFYHTLLVVEGVSPEPVLRMAALLHDVGKPETRLIDEEGETRFFGHEMVGAEIAVKFLRRLKFSNDFIDKVRLLVKNHMRLGSAPVFTDSAARRVIRDLEGLDQELLELVESDSSALKAGVRKMDLSDIRATLEKVRHETPREVLSSPLTGEEIMEILNLEPGPEVGRWKGFLTEKVLEGELAPGDSSSAKVLILSKLAEQS